MKILLISVIFILLALSLSGCAAKDLAQVAAPGVEKKTQTPIGAVPTWQDEWQQVIKEAKKEGTVAIISGFNPEARSALTKAFRQKYGIALEIITAGKSSTLAEKVIREHKSGLNLTDVFVIGGTTLLLSVKPAGLLAPLEPTFLLPEVRDPQAWWTKKLNFMDKNKTIFPSLAYVNAPLTINTNMVKAEELASMKDLLNPKWKGKIILTDPTRAGGGGNWFAVFGDVIMGYDYMRDLARMEPVIMYDDRLQVEWLAKGKYPLGVAMSPSVVTEFISSGAPLTPIVTREGSYVSSGSTLVAFAAKAPHPNGAKLFINWFLSREGQTIVSKALGQQSARVDVPTDFLLPLRVRQPGVNYIANDNEEVQLTMPQKQEIAREIFGHLMK